MTKVDLSILAPASEGLALIIRLHDREADRALIAGLRDSDAAGLFGALLDGDPVAEGLRAALDALPDPLAEATLDQLAAEYADVYLTHSYRIAPTGSVWLTEEHLERQEPMFAVREWYHHYGITVPDWKMRSDDHIVHELQFLEHLLGLGTMSAAGDAAKFMDQHVLSWVPQFCTRMAERCQQPLLIATAGLTATYLESLRDLLEALTGVARATPEDLPKPYTLSELDQDIAFVPGASESW